MTQHTAGDEVSRCLELPLGGRPHPSLVEQRVDLFGLPGGVEIGASRQELPGRVKIGFHVFVRCCSMEIQAVAHNSTMFAHFDAQPMHDANLDDLFGAKFHFAEGEMCNFRLPLTPRT